MPKTKTTNTCFEFSEAFHFYTRKRRHKSFLMFVRWCVFPLKVVIDLKTNDSTYTLFGISKHIVALK